MNGGRQCMSNPFILMTSWTVNTLPRSPISDASITVQLPWRGRDLTPDRLRGGGQLRLGHLAARTNDVAHFSELSTAA